MIEKVVLRELAAIRDELDTLFGIDDIDPDPVFREHGIKIAEEMYRRDAQVRAAHLTKCYAILAPGWEIIPGGQEPADRAAAALIKNNFEMMQGTIEGFLLNVMSAFLTGFSINEIIWKQFDQGDLAGSWGIDSLKAKPAKLFKFDQDNFGNLKPKGLLLKKGLSSWDKLPSNKFVIYSYNKAPEDHRGRSDLTAAYVHYYIKQALVRLSAKYLEKYSAPITTGKYPDGEDQKIVREIYKYLKDSRVSSIAVVPKDWELDVQQANLTGGLLFTRLIDYHDRMILRAYLFPSLVMDEGLRSGSLALGKSQQNTFSWTMAAIGQEIAERVMNEQVIRRVVDANLRVSKYPSFGFKEMETEDEKQIADIVDTLVSKVGISVEHPGIKDILAKLGIKDDEEAKGLLPAEGAPTTKQPSSEQKDPGEQEPVKATLKFGRQGRSSTLMGGHAHLCVVDEVGNGQAQPLLHMHAIRRRRVGAADSHRHNLGYVDAEGYGWTTVEEGHAHPVRIDDAGDGVAMSVRHTHEIVGWAVEESWGHVHEVGPAAPVEPGRLRRVDGDLELPPGESGEAGGKPEDIAVPGGMGGPEWGGQGKTPAWGEAAAWEDELRRRRVQAWLNLPGFEPPNQGFEPPKSYQGPVLEFAGDEQGMVGLVAVGSERRVYVQRLKQELDQRIDELALELSTIAERSKTAFIDQARRAKILERRDWRALDKIKIKHVGEWKDKLHAGLVWGLYFGATQALAEVEAKVGPIELKGPRLKEVFTPRDVLRVVDEFEGMVPLISGKSAELGELARTEAATLIQSGVDASYIAKRGVLRGREPRQVYVDMEMAWSQKDLTADERKRAASRRAQRQRARAARAGLTAENATMDSFNLGRSLLWETPEVRDYIRGYQYSAVMDDRTTDLCADLHGHTAPINDPVWSTYTPQNHHRCRSVIFPITVIDDTPLKGGTPTSEVPSEGFVG